MMNALDNVETNRPLDYRSVIEMADRQVQKHLLPAQSNGTELALRARRLHERILIIADIARHAGIAVLMSLWEMYKTGLWLELVPEGVSDFTFYDYVESYHSHLTTDYLRDMARIIMGVFQRCHSDLIALPGGERITPELLVENATMLAMKRTSQKLIHASEEEARQLIIMLAEGKSADEIEEAATEAYRDTTQLPEYTISLMRDGSWEITMRGLNDKQVELFRQIVGMYAEERLK